MSNPQQLRYSKEHEWLSPAEDGVSTVGITEHAANALGDVVYVQLPEVGDTVTAGETCGELESTKSVSDIYAPVSGTVVARNESLDATPELVNNDPYGGGWLFDVTVSDASSLDALLDSAAYQTSLEG
jgi:glycine cleavage system H protein